MYNRGVRELQKDFNMLALIKNTKNLLTVAKCQNLINPIKLEKLQHTRDNIIDIDDETSDEELEEQKLMSNI